jgi:hypothetical protein
MAGSESLLPAAGTAILGLGITRKCCSPIAIPFLGERALAALLLATIEQNIDVPLQSVGIAAMDEDERNERKAYDGTGAVLQDQGHGLRRGSRGLRGDSFPTRRSRVWDCEMMA